MTDISEGTSCDHETELEMGKKRVVLSCGECKDGGTEITDPVCFSSLINVFLNEYNISEIVLSGPIEKQYVDETVELIHKFSMMVEEIDELSLRDPLEKKGLMKDIPRKKMQRSCGKCDHEPDKVFTELKEQLLEDYGEYLRKLERAKDLEIRSERDICKYCRKKTRHNMDYLYRKSIPVSGYILKTAYNIIRDKGSGQDSPEDFYDGINYLMFDRGIERIVNTDKYIRPAFSSSWLQKKPPQNKELIEEYHIGDSEIEHHYLTDEMEGLYHISLVDYDISEDEAEIIQSSIDELSERYPENISMKDRVETRKYIRSVGKDIIKKNAREEGVSLGESKVERTEKLDRLSSILARNTAGLGALEPILKDDKVQDIYVDAPAPSNPVYIKTSALAEEDMSGTCMTNLILGKEEIEGILSRVRMESGRPFSESEPILEHDMKEFDIRSTIIGKPMSPEGVALALRRHSREPWTLLKLIANGTLTPLSAGLFSFLIDGRSTILIAGSRSAGKTSLLSALMLEFPKNQRMITIEDTLELPTRRMQDLGYKVQNIRVGSSGAGFQSSPEEALRVSLRLGESAMVMGEVRGEEAKTLYEAMRAGTAGSSVLGTFHANSASSVFERAVYDIGIPAKSFLATDIVSVIDLKRPRGVQEPVRKLTQIAELDRESEADGEFRDLMSYDASEGWIDETDILKYSSQVVSRIARSWNMDLDEAYRNIKARARYREIIVNTAKEEGIPELLGPEWVRETNSRFWKIMENGRKRSYEDLIEEWKEWFLRRVKYA